MRYVLFHCLDESLQVDPADDSDVPGSPAAVAQDAWDDEMQARGVMLSGVRLAPAADARTVRVRGGEVLVSDGPFAETKEQIAGFNVLECAGLDEAIKVASQHPTAKIGTFELRPIWKPETQKPRRQGVAAGPAATPEVPRTCWPGGALRLARGKPPDPMARNPPMTKRPP